MNNQQQKGLYAAIFNTVIDGVITIDERGVIQTVNPAAGELFGYTAAEMIGQKVNMLMPEPHHTDHDGYIHNYKTTGERKIIGIGREVMGKKKDGTKFPFRLAISEVQTEVGKIFTGIIHDLTEQKRAENRILEMNRDLEKRVAERTEELSDVVNKLIQTNKELEAKERELLNSLERERELGELKSRFVTTASHEFRTPLTTIKSSASLISRYTEPGTEEKREKHVQRIQSAVVNLTGILNDFLSLSKLEDGKTKSEAHDFSLTNLCSEVIEHIGTILKKDQQVVLINNIKNKNVHAHERFIRNVMINLLSNASKYSGEGKTIIFKVENDDKTIRFSVKDEGIGIPADEQQHLFTLFFRANNVSNIQGTGLGLNIVKRYLELMDGTIDFESEEGVGTKFRVSVPI